VCLQVFSGFGADAPHLANGQRSEEGLFRAGRDDLDRHGRGGFVMAGFADVGGNLGDELVGGRADRTGQAEFAPDAHLDLDRDLLDRLGQVADIEEGLVDRDGLHKGGDLLENVHHLAGILAVELVMSAHSAQAGTQAQGLGHGHGGVHTLQAGGVGAGSDHPAPVGRAAGGESDSAQRGVEQLLDRAEEGVQVHV